MTKGVYVLVLNNGKRYVGSSENIEKRVSEHKHGRGAAYTKRHGIVGQDVVITTQDGTIESWEQNETLAQMIKYGVHNVRGFQWVTDDLSPNDAHVVKTLMCGLFSLCNHCGRPGHFGADCPDPYSKAKWMVEVCSISEPKSNKDAISELITQSSVSSSTEPKPSKPKPVQSTVQNHREIAPTGRAKCKKCGLAISKGEYRVGEETTYKGQQCIKWFHENCYAQKNSSVPAIQTHPSQTFHLWFASEYEKRYCTPSKKLTQSTKKTPAKKTATSTCKRCGRCGHDSETCYAKKHVDGSYIEDSDSDSDDEDTCYRCGRVGHWASNCYAKKHVDGGYIKD
jgi:hypothetical protein